jgi:hypothetical protein
MLMPTADGAGVGASTGAAGVVTSALFTALGAGAGLTSADFFSACALCGAFGEQPYTDEIIAMKQAKVGRSQCCMVVRITDSRSAGGDA